VRFNSGLRSEIIINIIVLTAAALLLSGFLLTKLLERELIAQRREHVTGLMEVLSATVSKGGPIERGVDNAALTDKLHLLEKISTSTGLEALTVADREGKPLAVYGDFGALPFNGSVSAEARYSDGPSVRVTYDASWYPFQRPSNSYLLITVPVNKRGKFTGTLQARFTLKDVRERVTLARKLILLYALLYGSILVLFGVYVLSRSVLRPVRRLREMTQLIAAGDLNQAVPPEGPVEIADLAGSFNSMVVALRQGQLEREAHIEALEHANSEVRKAQDELVRSEKLASIGHLAAGMAHEIGNPLGAVVGYLEILKEESASGREQEIIGRAQAEVDRIDRLVRELLDYAAPHDGQVQLFDPAGAMAEARDILAHQGLFDGIEFDDQLPAALPPTRMVRHKLVQVFINLLLNARDALVSGGTIRLRAGDDGESLWLAVADTGTGMNAEVLAHIFEPFYSTKGPGKGRGLGLAVCQQVVGEIGGRVEAASVPGEWSEFRVWLPITESEAEDV